MFLPTCVYTRLRKSFLSRVLQASLKVLILLSSFEPFKLLKDCRLDQFNDLFMQENRVLDYGSDLIDKSLIDNLSQPSITLLKVCHFDQSFVL